MKPPNSGHNCMGPIILSFVERLSSFGGYFVQSVHIMSFAGRFVLFQSVVYRRFHYTDTEWMERIWTLQSSWLSKTAKIFKLPCYVQPTCNAL